MNPPSSAMASLAQLLLDHETGAQPDAIEMAAGADAVCRKLADRLEPLVGATGFHTLLARALHLTRPEYPLLEDVRSGTPEAWLAGLGDRAGTRDAGEVREAAAAVIAGFLGLVAYFIGDDLAVRLVSRAWPELPPGTAGSAFEGEAI